MTKKRKKGKENKFFRLILIVLTIIYSIYLNEMNETYSLDNSNDVFKEVSTDLKVSYLDVGQADSILIENNNEYMLIDAGNNEDGNLLVKYFKDQGIDTFKYIIGTHPHEDHIGGLDDIINNFKVDTIYMPDVITTTKTFMDVLTAIENKNMTYTVPKIGENFTLGETEIEVLYTDVDESDLNNTSIVVRLDFGNNSFLFTGDATDTTEEILLKNNLNIKADILKVGHHGSRYSTTNEFLKEVNPKYAIISVGKENSYNHPEDIILKKLKDNNIEVHRTDIESTIIITSNGNTIDIKNINTNLDG